jgi:hypothetical protein
MAIQAAKDDDRRESRWAVPISHRALKDIEEGIGNLDRGLVGDRFDIEELQDLLNEP